MRILWLAGILLALPLPSSAQDKPLGDVAREARAQKLESVHANKTITNDDFGPHLDPIGLTEDPVAAFNKARAALLADGRHSCQRETSGNSGPGWSDSRLTEVAGPDRFHIVMNSQNGQNESIIVGPDVYRRPGSGPWQKLSAAEANFMSRTRLDLPDVLQFGYQPGDLKLMGQESVDGVPTFHYQYKVHVVDMDRTVDIWLRGRDHLPLKTHMVTVTTSALTAPVTWQETASCSYGHTFTIVAPQ